MSEWSSGTGALGRILYRAGQAVGMVDSPEIALEIVAAMRVVERLVGPAPESGRERSPEPFVAVRAEVCGACLSREDVGADGRFEAHVNSSGHPCSGSRRVAP